MSFKEWLATQEAVIGTTPKATTALRAAFSGMSVPAGPAKIAAPKKLFSPSGTLTTPRQPSGVAFGK